MASTPYWEKRGLVAILLLPLAVVFALLAGLRRRLYRVGLLKSRRFPVPVIVVGNITAGGAGKTPLVIWLAGHLRQKGFRPGIVSRGYGGRASKWPQQVRADSDPVMVGDEAVLLAAESGCPVCVGPDRPEAVAALLSHQQCDIVISDDGLQHYALGRTVEIAVIDGVRRFGNNWPIPAGPMREPESRLRRVDLVITQGGVPRMGESAMQLVTPQVVPLSGGETEPLSAWSGRRVHAVAGIGNPQRFFDMLAAADIEVQGHAYADHHAFRRQDLEFGDDLPVLMTTKDAVKCRRFTQGHFYVVKVTAQPDEAFAQALDRKLEGMTRG